MLVLISTPIGNLQDISLRAVESLRTCDLILCEDTRQSQILLKHHNISRPLQSFHAFNEKQKEDQMIKALQAGQTICLISDAGTPAICDPGQRLIDRCHNEGLLVSAVPGPCSITTALSLSGFVMPPFQFGGFLPKKPGALKDTLIDALLYPGVSAFFVPPHQIEKALSLIAQLDPKRPVCIARELTKKFEEIKRGLAHTLTPNPKGEFCLVIDRGTLPQGDLVTVTKELQERFDLSQKDAIKLAADICGIPKRAAYTLLSK